MDIDKGQLLEIIPHYIAMLLLVFVVLAIVRGIVGDIGFWIEFALIVVVVFLYRPIVIQLGVAPDGWE